MFQNPEMMTLENGMPSEMMDKSENLDTMSDHHPDVIKPQRLKQVE